jgi:hypothetical protein
MVSAFWPILYKSFGFSRKFFSKCDSTNDQKQLRMKRLENVILIGLPCSIIPSTATKLIGLLKRCL